MTCNGTGKVRVPAPWGRSTRDDWDCAAIGGGPQALPMGSGCWMGPCGTPALADAQGCPRGEAPEKGLAEATQRHHQPQAVPSTDALGTWCGSHWQDQCGHVLRPQETPSDLQTGLETAAQTHPGTHLQPLAAPIPELREPGQGLAGVGRQGWMDRWHERE